MIIGSATSPQLWFQISHTKNAISNQAALELSFINAFEIKQTLTLISRLDILLCTPLEQYSKVKRSSRSLSAQAS